MEAPCRVGGFSKKVETHAAAVALLHALQVRPRPQDAARYASDGSQTSGSRLDDRGSSPACLADAGIPVLRIPARSATVLAADRIQDLAVRTKDGAAVRAVRLPRVRRLRQIYHSVSRTVHPTLEPTATHISGRRFDSVASANGIGHHRSMGSSRDSDLCISAHSVEKIRRPFGALRGSTWVDFRRSAAVGRPGSSTLYHMQKCFQRRRIPINDQGVFLSLPRALSSYLHPVREQVALNFPAALRPRPCCPVCQRSDDMERNGGGVWVCRNPPCAYRRALERVQGKATTERETVEIATPTTYYPR